MKQMIAFDLDGTLAESKQPLEPPMGKALAGLLGVADVAVISGGDWPQFEKQVAARLPDGTDLTRLWLMPTTGTKLYQYDGANWKCLYAENFDAAEKAKIRAALDKAVADAGLGDERLWGERIEDRGSQFTFSGLGQQAPLDAKDAWDPDRKKRTALQASLRAALPDLSINIGGSTSIDITRQGVDKAYGLKKLADASGVTLGDMLFLGDAIFPGGNDYPAVTLGLDTIRVRDPIDTLTAIAAITACLK
jgi:HAD superfamily hydrolase (TIGR01484 family)